MSVPIPGFLEGALPRAPHRRFMGLAIERTDSEFGRYTHAAWSDPHDVLLPLARVWYFEGTLVHAIERHYPDGNCGVIVQLETPHAPADAIGDERYPPVCANGIVTRPFGVVAPPGLCRVIGLNLDPATLHAVLGTPLAELRDVTLDLHDIVGNLVASELGTRCADARDPAAIVGAALRWLRDRVVRARAMDDGVSYALARLQNARGDVAMAALELETGIAGPRLARRFAATIGTTPKRYARILRFHHALELIRAQRRTDLVAAATAAGYYDQAHMYGDFTEFCDRTPAEFARALLYPGTLSIAENAEVSLFSKTA